MSLMSRDIELKRIHERIRLMQSEAAELKKFAQVFPAVGHNARRILASLKMLEIHVSDLVRLDSELDEGPTKRR